MIVKEHRRRQLDYSLSRVVWEVGVFDDVIRQVEDLILQVLVREVILVEIAACRSQSGEGGAARSNAMGSAGSPAVMVEKLSRTGTSNRIACSVNGASSTLSSPYCM